MGAAASASPVSAIDDESLVERLAQAMKEQPDRNFDHILEKAKKKAAQNRKNAVETTAPAVSSSSSSESASGGGDSTPGTAGTAGTASTAGSDGHPSAINQPFTWSGILGPKLVLPSGNEVSTDEHISGRKKIVLYFGGHWCAPCRDLLPQLGSVYSSERSRQANVEVVFVSSDKSEEEFKKYHSLMPFPAVPFASRDLKDRVSQAYGVSGVPRLVVLDGVSGKTITLEGRLIMHQIFEPPATATQKPGFAHIEETLRAHNRFRSMHGAKPLEWSDHCADQALIAAQACKEANAMFHSNCKEHGHGQNVYAYVGSEAKPDAAAVNAWYGEIVDPGYPFGDLPTCPQGTGHFTQVVWRGTTHVGMAWAGDPESGMFCVANYAPFGNLQGGFGKNVLPATGGHAAVEEAIAKGKSEEADFFAKQRAKNSKAKGSEGGSDGGEFVVLTGGADVENESTLEALLARIPDFVKTSAPDVVSNIVDNAKKSGCLVKVNLSSSGITTIVEQGGSISTSKMTWG